MSVGVGVPGVCPYLSRTKRSCFFTVSSSALTPLGDGQASRWSAGKWIAVHMDWRLPWCMQMILLLSGDSDGFS